jgi:hypothetical protein
MLVDLAHGVETGVVDGRMRIVSHGFY